jgi:hypothetical protein
MPLRMTEGFSWVGDHAKLVAGRLSVHISGPK